MRIASGAPWEEPFGYSRAAVAGPFVFVSGCTSTPEFPADPAAQARLAIVTGLTALREAGCCAADVVRTRMYVVDRADADAVGRVHGEVFRDARPATSMVIVAGLIDPAMRFEIEMLAYTGGAQ